jgi:hypothetical protein
MALANNLVELRQLLVERFPHTRLGLPAAASSVEPIPTGVPSLDKILSGGLPRGALTELVGVGPGSGSCLVLHALLRETARNGQFMALIDGADSFDACAVEATILARLLWLRCVSVEQALKASDLLLRDPNLPLVVLDLKLNTARELRKLSSSVWHRFVRLLEQSETAVLVVTPEPLVGGVSWRVECENALKLEALAGSPANSLSSLRFNLLRSPAAGTEAKTG